MGAWRKKLGAAVVLAALLRATPAAAGTVMEPIARLSLEGGWDSNALYDGRSADAIGAPRPEVGLRLRAPLWDLRTTYGGELVYFERLVAGGIWNHRAGAALDARPTRRTRLAGQLRLAQAYDPSGLAQAGVFRTGRVRALVVGGARAARLPGRPTRRHGGDDERAERPVRGRDRRRDARALGRGAPARGAPALPRGAYGFGVYQSFERAPRRGRGLRTRTRCGLRARWRVDRHAHGGCVGRAGALAPRREPRDRRRRRTSRCCSRPAASTCASKRGTGSGSARRLARGSWTGRRSRVGRRWARRWFARGDGGLWRSGTVPSGRDAVTGYMVAGEAGAILGGNLRLSITGAHLGRIDLAAAEFRRTAVGLRLGWELPGR